MVDVLMQKIQADFFGKNSTSIFCNGISNMWQYWQWKTQDYVFLPPTLQALSCTVQALLSIGASKAVHIFTISSLFYERL